LKADDKWIESTDWTEATGADAANRLLDRKSHPTAIFVANFLMMIGVLRVLQQRNIRVPDTVEVANSDDSEWLDVFSPAITTVVQPSYDMGVNAADLALARLADAKRPFTKIVLEPSLRVRP
jgi:LacI family transcriptional regulator